MTKEEKLNKLNHYLSAQILLVSMLFSYMDDNYEEMKNVNPTLANICKKDIYTLRRNHETYMKKFRPLLNNSILVDFENLRTIIDDFIESKL